MELRANLEALAAEEGPEAFHARLVRADPKAAEEIHANNVKRVIRAMILEMTGRAYLRT